MAIAVTLLMVSAAVMPAMGILTEEKDSSADSTVTPLVSAGAEIFTQESKDFKTLAYIGDKLPESLDATSWVKDGSFWYNINEKDTDYYGKYLTYGQTDMLDDQIRADVLAKYSGVFSSTSFQLLQVHYTVNTDCTITIDVAKTGETTQSKTVPVSMLTAGSTISVVKKAAILTIDSDSLPGAPDILVSNVSGVYNVTVKCDGIKTTELSLTCKGEYVSIGGYVEDADGDPITWGHSDVDNVIYTVDGSSSENYAPIKDGEYTIDARIGSIIEIVGVNVADYSFSDHYHSYGTIQSTYDPLTDAPTFTADQKTTTMEVLDSSGNGVSNAAVTAVWYYEVKVGDMYYFYTNVESLRGVIAGKASAQYTTDSSGSTVLAYSEPVPASGTVDINLASGWTTGTLLTRLYLTATAENYKFLVNDMPETGSSSVSGLPVPGEMENGNGYLDTGLPEQTITAEDRSIYVTVKGAGAYTDLDSVALKATWFYQKQVDATYLITKVVPTEVETAGVAYVHGSTGADGKVLVSFRSPFVTPGSGYSSWLYIYATDDYFTFSYLAETDIESAASEKTISELVTGMKGCVVSNDPASLSAVFESTEKAYTISADIGGSVPEETTVTYKRTGASGSVTRTLTTTTGTFSFIIKGGDASTITPSAVGYTFTYAGVDIPDAGVGFPSTVADISDSNFAASPVSVVADRDTPVLISTYGIDNLEDKTLLTVTIRMADKEYRTYVKSVGEDATINVYGWKNQTVQSITVTGNALRIDDLVAGSTVSAVKTITTNVVAYYSESGTPTISNVTKDVTIDAIYKDKICASAVTGSDGIASMDTPESGVTFKYKSYAIVPTVGTGVYDGYLMFNMYGYMAGATVNTVSVTIKYLSSSSLDNIQEPTCTRIVTQDDVVNVLKQGETQKFVAPTLSGFSFAGWYLNGEKVANGNEYTFDTAVVGDGVHETTLLAIYSAETVVEPTPGVDNSVIAIGIAAIVIALLALVYVIFQSRRF